VTPRGEARHRPELKLPLTPIDWLLIFLGILSVGFLVVLWVLTWPQVPEHIPEDFPATLNRRRELLILPILGLKLYIIMLAVTAVPSDYNHPWRIKGSRGHSDQMPDDAQIKNERDPRDALRKTKDEGAPPSPRLGAKALPSTPDNAEFSYRMMRRFVLLVAAIAANHGILAA
jgi:hypothetical protein